MKWTDTLSDEQFEELICSAYFLSILEQQGTADKALKEINRMAERGIVPTHEASN